MEDTKTQAIKKAETQEAPAPAKTLKAGEYIEGLGRRKRATARVRIYNAKKKEDSAKEKGFEVNGRPSNEFFTSRQVQTALEPLNALAVEEKFTLTVQVRGGGTTGQAEAVRMGLARALEELEPSWRGKLKRAGYLTRDPREKERKKYGLKKARRAPQFSKR